MNAPPSPVTIIDYGVGNILSVRRALEHVGAQVIVTDDPALVSDSEKLVLPGVGAFARAMEELDTRHLIDPIKAFAASDRPFLGICLGMQLMLDKSEEFGDHQGLGLIPGDVKAIPNTTKSGTPHKIPHIGWNTLKSPTAERWQGTLLDAQDPDLSMYFVHSFAANPTNESDVLATTEYNGHAICAALQHGSMTGFQGHPEKSGPAGLQILEAFVQRAR